MRFFHLEVHANQSQIALDVFCIAGDDLFLKKADFDYILPSESYDGGENNTLVVGLVANPN